MGPLPPGPKSFGVVNFLRAGFISPEPVLKRFAAEYGYTFRVKTLNGPLTFFFE